MHSQVVGIVWISVILLLVATLAIFLPKRMTHKVADNGNYTTDTAVLTKIEDSVYRSRRKASKNEKSRMRNDEFINSSSPTTLYPLDKDSPSSSKNNFTSYKKQPLRVELNSADTTTLQLLHGIGPTYASRIVRYRERLGGFTDKEQLLEVYGFTPELLSHIAPYVTVDTLNINKIDINSIPLKQLIKHPYIEYYQARDIVNLRNRGVRFENAEDLKTVPSMADSTLKRLLPYIKF